MAVVSHGGSLLCSAAVGFVVFVGDFLGDASAGGYAHAFADGPFPDGGSLLDPGQVVLHGGFVACSVSGCYG